MQAIIDLQKTVTTLQDKVLALEARLTKAVAPDWFAKEWGDALKDVTNNPLHDADYWEDMATVLRLLKTKNL